MIKALKLFFYFFILLPLVFVYLFVFIPAILIFLMLFGI
jgi:hypothetical protein